jgi:hypothetical protein
MLAVEPVAGAEGGTLLRGDVLKAMLEMYSPRVQQRAGKAFAIKNMNIVDSLLPINNLGRSVNKASKARIRKALAHGSHMLNSIFDKVCSCIHIVGYTLFHFVLCCAPKHVRKAGDIWPCMPWGSLKCKHLSAGGARCNRCGGQFLPEHMERTAHAAALCGAAAPGRPGASCQLLPAAHGAGRHVARAQPAALRRVPGVPPRLPPGVCAHRTRPGSGRRA